MTITDNSTTIDNHDSEESHGTVILFLSYSVLAACTYEVIVCKLLKNRLPIPFTVVVLILGLIIGVIAHHIKGNPNDFLAGEIELSEINPHLLFYIFLPALIFHSAFNCHFHIVKQQLLSAILLAGPGVFISIFIVAICSIYIFPYDWSWLEGFLFGSILSAKDAIAVIPLLQDSDASKLLTSLVESESILSDGSTFVAFLTFKNIVVGGDHSAKIIIIDIIKYSIGGPAFGFACGIICVFILNRIYNKLNVEITITFGVAYLIFYVADVELGISGALALGAMGLYMAKYKYCISSKVQIPLASAWRMVIYIINILIFTITGIILAKSFLGTVATISGRDFGFSIVLYLVILIARALTIAVLYPLMRHTGVHLSWKDCIILIWSNLRGSMALILVLIVFLDARIDLQTRDRFLFHASIIVLLTLVVNGTSSKFLVRILGLNRGTKGSQIILVQALEHMRRQTLQQLTNMKQDEKFADVDWKMLSDYLPDKLLEELDQEQNTTLRRDLSCHSNLNFPVQTEEISRPPPITTEGNLKRVPTIYQLNSMPNRSLEEPNILPVINPTDTNEEDRDDIRKEIITRFLTARSIDYEKQWYLGMIRRRTLDILTESVEQAKQKYSIKVHWKLIVEYFRLSILLMKLLKFERFDIINRWKNKLLFDHIFLTIELTLSFHSAKTRMQNILVKFPELIYIDREIHDELLREVDTCERDAMNILLELKQSYPLCWVIQMTKRCAQMLLKYESVAIIQLYETGILADNEYSHILKLIESKSFVLEYGRIQMPPGQNKIIENAFNVLRLFRSLSDNEKEHWKSVLKLRCTWFQPTEVLVQSNQTIGHAFLIIRGIVECDDDPIPTCYKSGAMIGIDSVFFEHMSARRTYKAGSGLVEAYAIDRDLLSTLLNDSNLSRSIYDEIALHTLINNYQTRLQLTHAQLQLVLSEIASFYKNESDLEVHLKATDRLLLLSGTLVCHSDNKETTMNSIEFLSLTAPTMCKLNSSSIVYTWTRDDEMYSPDVKLSKLDVPVHHTESISVQPFYPNFLGDTVGQFISRHHSSLVTRPVSKSNLLQFIPTEIAANVDSIEMF
ncbi:unnamed protein product [Adineta ricciae]|uniref:Cyclic nucleotide-binding domain-containing protein n=1 Tax=Adineta ricciae TaxID=249248 RepID=A0A815NAT3_ADIRI|nr:unnamed protein product [Adineta ricciae]CAF1429496.1 unnamed protein product [Adineta ricciae]